MAINRRIAYVRRVVAALGVAGTCLVAGAQVQNLRVTEVSPSTGQVEVTNTGAAFSTSLAHPFCHLFNYMSVVPNGTLFGAGEAKIFGVSGMNTLDSDFWLYTSSPFANPANIVHGVKWGPTANVGRTSAAVTRVPPMWSGVADFAPAPPVGSTLAWDGFGISPRDWYIDQTPTLGSADFTTPGVVANDIAASGGTQSFENVSLGDTVEAISDWVVVDSSPIEGMFTVRAVNDVRGVVAPRSGLALVRPMLTRGQTAPLGTLSSRWLRIRDQDAANVQNRFYSATVTAPGVSSYSWSFYMNIEETPPGAAATNRPRLVIQHGLTGGGFANAWGIELADSGGSLVVTGVGGAGGPASLFALSGPTAVGAWIRVDLSVDLVASTVSASINEGAPVSLPIALSGTATPEQFRFCYRGEGEGNVNTMLLDDLSVSVVTPPPFCAGNSNGDGIVNFDDITETVANWLNDYSPGTGPGDSDGSGVVDFGDINSTLANWLSVCP